MFSTRILILIAAGGAVGAASRYCVSQWAIRWFGDSFPWGTFLVNVAGCLCMGGLMQWIYASPSMPPEWRLGLTVGLLGGLTTFSSFGFETYRLLEAGRWELVAANVAGNMLLGVAAVWTGTVLGKWLV